jgi:hypothetical protein
MTNPNEKEKDIHTRWAEYCQEEGRGLTKWEEEFLDSVLNQLRTGRNLSERQAEILERIYVEKTPN